MSLQDLTPQLRTRLSRVERAVGVFVSLALALLVFGFGYYLYNTAKRKGWFLTKAPYYTFIDRATGLKVGDPVMLMGFDAGRITAIEPMPAEQFIYNVYVQFELRSPHYGYMWTEGSFAKIATADLLGKRVLEVSKGTGGYPTYVSHPLRELESGELRSLPDVSRWLLGQELYDASGTNLLAPPLTPLTNLALLTGAAPGPLVVLDSRETRKALTGVWDYKKGRYLGVTRRNKGYWLEAVESPAVTERLERLFGQVEKALPDILSLTNQLGAALSNTASLTSNLNAVALGARPVVSNLATLTASLDRPGALGDLLLPTNINSRLDTALAQAGSALGKADSTLEVAGTNLTMLAQNLNRSLDHLASITSNLNSQVEANTNILGAISKAISDADELVQGLKRHWLLRSAFRPKDSSTPPPGEKPEPLRSPKAREDEELKR